MSLINDALKRAKQAHEQQTPPQFRGAPLHTTPTPPRKSNLLPIVLAGSVLLLLLLGAGIFLTLKLTRPRPQVATSVPTAAPAQPAPVAAQPVVEPTPPPPAPEPTPEPPPVVPEPAVAAEPSLQISSILRLQGVLYNPARPAAIINGRTLFVGDHLGDVKIIAIGQQNVTTVWNGQTNVLTMER